MINYKITLEYDGRNFSGWQRQGPGAGRTVQGVVEEALSRLCDQSIILHGSGRTDAGVHARGQVASFQAESRRTPDQIIRGGNCLLPPDVAIIDAQEVHSDFHARFSAIGKIYQYELMTTPTRRPLYHQKVWWVGPGLDWNRAESSLPLFMGEKDFAAFQSVGSSVKSTVRMINQADLTRPDVGFIRLTFGGSGFLRHMVRAMTGALVAIARGRLSGDQLADIIASGDRSRSAPTAPPDGLYLAKVLYR